MIGEKIELPDKITEIDWINGIKYSIIKEINAEIKNSKGVKEIEFQINKLSGLKKKLFVKVIKDIAQLKKDYEAGDKLAKIKLTNYGLLVRKKNGNG